MHLAKLNDIAQRKIPLSRVYGLDGVSPQWFNVVSLLTFRDEALIDPYFFGERGFRMRECAP